MRKAMTEADQLDQLILCTRNLPHQVAVREVNEYFRSLSEETARALAESRPEQVGSRRDGGATSRRPEGPAR